MKIVNQLLIAGSFALATSLSFAEEWLKSISEFTLQDHLGNTQSLDMYQDKKFIVFYVQGNGCPIARIALPNLREVRDEFESQGIVFLAFNSNIQDNMAAIQKEVANFGIDFPVMKDEGQVLAKALGVERTAEVFIVDPRTRDVLYRGPINDQLGYETQRVNASSHFLKDALNTVLAGGKVDMDDIPDSKGCLIAIFDS
ncbi:MAG: hypothetical protein RLZZ385_56 [Pseudomonadota bacterium]|jgi:peroxiredoxin